MSIFLMFYYTVSSLPRADSCETRQNQRFTGISSDYSYYDTIILMYRTLADPKPLRRLPHRRAVLYNIICNLHGSLFNIIFQKNPPANIVFTMYAGVSEVMPTYLRLLQISVCIPVPKSLKKSTLFVNIKKHNIIKCIRR